MYIYNSCAPKNQHKLQYRANMVIKRGGAGKLTRKVYIYILLQQKVFADTNIVLFVEQVVRGPFAVLLT